MTTTVRAALAEYFARNGFSEATYTAPTVTIPIGPLRLLLPNTKGRKAAVRWHDLHHLATGYGTDLVGEGEIGAWELAAGCRGVAAYVYNGMAMGLGLLLAPRRTLTAFRDGRSCRTLYALSLDYDAVLDGSLTRLREMLGVPSEGIARHPARVHGAAPRPHASA